MAIRKLRNSWWIDFRHNHTRYRKRSPENSKAGAEAYEAVIRQQLARDGEIVSFKEISKEKEQEQTFEKFAWTWFNSYVKANNKPSVIENKRMILRATLLPFFGKIPVGQISTMKVEQFKSKKIGDGLSNKSINNYLTILSTCLKAAEEWIGLKSVPKIKFLKTPSLKTDYLTEEEGERLIATMTGIPREIVLTALKTGLRKGELKGLRWQDIDWSNRRLIVNHSWCRYSKGLTTPKSNKVRYVPLTKDVYATLWRRRKTSGPVFYTTEETENFDYWSLYGIMTEACMKAKLRRVGLHTLRHSYASHLVMKGAPLAAVQALLGHSDIRTTMRYAHLAQSSLREAVNLLEPGVPYDFGQPVGNAGENQNRKFRAQKSHLLIISLYLQPYFILSRLDLLSIFLVEVPGIETG